MLIDKFLQLSNAQAVTATAVSTNVIDAGATGNAAIGRDIGAGTPMYAVLTVGTTFTAAGLATLTAAIQSSNTEGSGYADKIASPAIPVASLVAGSRFVIPLPPGLDRYVRANYTVATGPMLTGALSLNVVDGYEYQVAYPDGLPTGA